MGVDKRFSKLLHDKDFSTTARVDRYGRKLDDSKEKKTIERLYDIEKDNSSDSETSGTLVEEPKDDFTQFDEDDGDTGDSESEEPVKYDPARGEGVESSSDEEDLPDDLPIDGRDLIDPEPDRENIPQGEVTSRFAIVNLDWDNIRAEDLFVAMNSFKPTLGSVTSVKVFPSQFGKERLSREDTEGPPKSIFAGGEDDESDDEKPINAKSIVKESLGEEFDMDKLRKYQLDRLRYYFAVVECDNAGTAKHIYDACDGAEYEASANFFDLRFIPDEEDFDEEPRDTCSASPEVYEPTEFVTDALQHSKVKLTWDDDDPKKAQFAKKAFSRAEIDDMELKAYLASSDSESGEDVATLKEKYRALLKAGQDASDDERPMGDMEITFAPGLSTADKADAVDPENETTIDKYKRKDAERKQRKRERKGIVEAEPKKQDLGFDDPFFSEAPSKSSKKTKDRRVEADPVKDAQKKAELDLLMMDDEDNVKGNNHFDMKNIIRKEKHEGKRKSKHAKKDF